MCRHPPHGSRLPPSPPHRCLGVSGRAAAGWSGPGRGTAPAAATPRMLLAASAAPVPSGAERDGTGRDGAGGSCGGRTPPPRPGEPLPRRRRRNKGRAVTRAGAALPAACPAPAAPLCVPGSPHTKGRTCASGTGPRRGKGRLGEEKTGRKGGPTTTFKIKKKKRECERGKLF